jgi:hypothetical protein
LYIALYEFLSLARSMYLSIMLYDESSQYLEEKEEEAKVLFSIFKYLSPLEKVSSINASSKCIIICAYLGLYKN